MMTTTTQRCLAIAFVSLAASLLATSPAVAEASTDEAEINARLYEQLSRSAGPTAAGKIETIAGQLYISEKNLDADVISAALAAVLDEQGAKAEAVAIRRTPRINFEINFPKNSADLTEPSRASLDELAIALRSGSYGEMRFMLGGHTDQDGDEAVNKPLSQARAEAARTYLVTKHRVPLNQLVARGFGASEPLRQVEKSLQDKRYNRRVDLRPIR